MPSNLLGVIDLHTRCTCMDTYIIRTLWEAKMKANGLWDVAVVLFFGISGLDVAQGQAQTQAPKPSGDVWTGVPTPPPGGPYPKVVIVKDLPPPSKAVAGQKPQAVPIGRGMDPVRYAALKEEARRRAMELRAKTP